MFAWKEKRNPEWVCKEWQDRLWVSAKAMIYASKSKPEIEFNEIISSKCSQKTLKSVLICYVEMTFYMLVYLVVI